MPSLEGAIRPLGGIEQYLSSRHSLGLHKNVVTVGRYAVPSSIAGDERRTKSCVERAVASVIGKLQGLRVCIAGEETRQPQFVGVATLDLRKHVEWKTVDTSDFACLERELEKENVRSWPDVAACPPWRLLMFLPSEKEAATAANSIPVIHVAFSAHHGILDGKSGQVFHQFLVETLNEQQQQQQQQRQQDGQDIEMESPEPVLRFSTPPQLLPPQEELCRFVISLPFFLRTLWHEFGPSWIKHLVASIWKGKQSSEAPTPYTGDQPMSISAPMRPTRVRLMEVSAAGVSALLAVSRAHGVTLTPVLHGMMLVSLARRLRKDTLENKTFSGATMVSLRPYVTLPKGWEAVDVNRVLGNFVASHDQVWGTELIQKAREDPASDEALWQAAAEVSASLRAYTSDVGRDNVMGLMGWVSDWSQWWRSKDGKPRPCTWEVSNVGAFAGAAAEGGRGDGDSDGDGWHLDRSFFTFTAPETGPLVQLTASSIRGGPMVLALEWQEGSIDEGLCLGLRDDLEACLMRLGK